MIKAIIFDFDGVIFNTEDVAYKLVKNLCKKQGIELKTKEEFKEMYNANFYKTMKKKGVKGKELDDFKKECEERLAKLHLKIFKAMPKVLKDLSHKYFLGIISSGFKEVIKKNLYERQLLNYFSLIIGSEVESKTKKIGLCLERFQLKPSEALYITDTAGDIKEAKKAKIKTMGVTWGFHSAQKLKKEKPNFVANKPEQIIKLLR